MRQLIQFTALGAVMLCFGLLYWMFKVEKAPLGLAYLWPLLGVFFSAFIAVLVQKPRDQQRPSSKPSEGSSPVPQEPEGPAARPASTPAWAMELVSPYEATPPPNPGLAGAPPFLRAMHGQETRRGNP